MKTVLLNEEYRCKDACVLALGFFDGVHAGHKKILTAAVDRARSAGLYSAVFTFWDTDGFKSNVPRIMPEAQITAVGFSPRAHQSFLKAS